MSLTFAACLLSTQNSTSQSLRFTAKVLNSSTKKPVPYATVQILNTYQGTSANEQGEFSLLIDKGDTLIISSIGFQSKVIFADLNNISIILNEEVKVLEDITVFAKNINAKKIVKKAFRSIKRNYISEPLTMNTFYRHYCKDDKVYGRLIEAAVDVYKSKGYRKPKDEKYKKDYYRLVQARRSFDNSFLKNNHVPIAFAEIIGSDMAAYQTNKSRDSPYMLFMSNTGNDLKANLKQYEFELDKISYMNGKEIYEIKYSTKKDDNMNLSGLKLDINHHGKFYITEESYAFLKVESFLNLGFRKTSDQIYYVENNGKYYLSHVIHDQKTKQVSDSLNSTSYHTAHIELLVNNIEIGKNNNFIHEPITEKVLGVNKYDSRFWHNYTTLSENPLEKEIKLQLEKDQSLTSQFEEKSEKDYKAYEQLIQDNNKLENLLAEGHDQIVYIDFWASWCSPCISEFIRSNSLVEEYTNQGVKFIYVSIDKDIDRWMKMKTRYGLKEREHLRIGNDSKILEEFSISEIPRYMMIYPDGQLLKYAPRPSSNEFKELLDLEIRQLNKAKD